MKKAKNINWITIKGQSAKSFYGFREDVKKAYAELMKLTAPEFANFVQLKIERSKSVSNEFIDMTNVIEFTEENYQNKIKKLANKVAGL